MLLSSMHGAVISEHLIQLRFFCTYVPVISLRRFVDLAKIQEKSSIHNQQGLDVNEIDDTCSRFAPQSGRDGLVTYHPGLAEA